MDNCYLRRVMPTVGSKPCFSSAWSPIDPALIPNLVKYQSRERFMHHVRRDWCVADALNTAGYKMEHRPIRSAFADMFRVASPIVSKGHSRGFDLWDILPRVQRKIDWARRLPEAVFFELFTCLVQARHEGQLTMQSPSRPRHHDRLINQIDVFRWRVGDCRNAGYYCGGESISWILVDAVIFNELASGLELDDDNEDDDTWL
ncbi:hypothetical protein F5Y03DRAFT_147271 [Xylaria venustula]|nr:hypothetical protein F5Y03DRAFT_147271 [Xylaria venustula]